MNTSRPRRSFDKVKKDVEVIKNAAKERLDHVVGGIRSAYEGQSWLKDVLENATSKLRNKKNASIQNPIELQRIEEHKKLSKSQQQRLLPSQAMLQVNIRANKDLGVPIEDSLEASREYKRSKKLLPVKPAKSLNQIIKGGLTASAILGGTATVGYMTHDSVQRGERLSQQEKKYEESTVAKTASTYEKLQQVAMIEGMQVNARKFRLSSGEVFDQKSLLEFEEGREGVFTVRLQDATAKNYTLVKVTAPSEEAFITNSDLWVVESPATQVELDVDPKVKRYERIYLQLQGEYSGEPTDLSDTSRFLPLLEMQERDGWGKSVL